MRTDQIWQNRTVAETFLTGVRGAIPFATEQINIALRILDQLSIPIQHVADLGCGDGTIAHAILTHYPDAHVTAIDFSEPMLEQAAQRLQPFGDRATLMQADLYTSDWQASLDKQAVGTFDAVLSGYCIHRLPDDRKQALYRDIFHQLRSGGCVLNIEHVASASPWIEALFNDTLVDSIYHWHQTQGDRRSREEIGQTFVYREDKKANILAPVEVQCEWLRAIGFQQVDCFFKFFELAVFGGMR